MNWMYRAVLAFALMAAPGFAADHWIEYRIGPFRIISDAGDKTARDRLDEMEQLRHVLGVLLGKDTLAVGGPSAGELKTVWPIDVVLPGAATWVITPTCAVPAGPAHSGPLDEAGAWAGRAAPHRG